MYKIMICSSRYEDHTRLQLKYSDLLLSIKGHNSKMDKTKANASHQSGYLFVNKFMTGSFGFKLSANFNFALKSKHTIPYIVLSNFDIKNGHQSQYMETGIVFMNAIFEN